jgi:phage protein D
VRPDYRIISPDGQNITDRFRDRLLSLTITDEAGVKSDTLRIAIEDSRRELALPEPDTRLEIQLGYAGALRDMGAYIIDEVKYSGPPDKIEIGGKAAAFATDAAVVDKYPPMQERRSRSWPEGTTIAAMVRTMSDETKLKTYVSPSSAGIALPHTDQSAESNISLLQRLAAHYNAWAKVSYGTIRFVDYRDTQPERNPGKAVSVSIDRLQVTTYSYGNKKRNAFNSVSAKWHDTDAAQLKTVTVPSDPRPPLLELDTQYQDEISARRAAESRYMQAARDGQTLSLTLPAPPGLGIFADATLDVTGFGSPLDGPWAIKTVTWSLSRSGLVCSLQCESTKTPSTETPD